MHERAHQPVGLRTNSAKLPCILTKVPFLKTLLAYFTGTSMDQNGSDGEETSGVSCRGCTANKNTQVRLLYIYISCISVGILVNWKIVQLSKFAVEPCYENRLLRYMQNFRAIGDSWYCWSIQQICDPPT